MLAFPGRDVESGVGVCGPGASWASSEGRAWACSNSRTSVLQRAAPDWLLTGTNMRKQVLCPQVWAS